MGRGIRGTERRSNSRRVRKNTMKRKLMRRKSKKRKSKKRKPMKRGNRRMRGGYFGENVIVSMGKLADSSKNVEFINRLDRHPADKVFISSVSNDSRKINEALTAYKSLTFEGEYVISCGDKPELNEALSHGVLLNKGKILEPEALTDYTEAVNSLSEMIGANMRTESRHDSVVAEYNSRGVQCEPNKSKLSASVCSSFVAFLSKLSSGGRGIFIEDEWFPSGPASKRGRRGRPAYSMGMTGREEPYFLSTGGAPNLGDYLNELNAILMTDINPDIKGGKSFFADLEVPFALMVNSKDQIDASRVAQGEWLNKLEENMKEAGAGAKHSVLIDAMNSTFTRKYGEIFVQTDIYSNPKEMDDLLAILCLSRMCDKLYLSFDSPALGINLRKMFPFLVKEGFIPDGGTNIEFVN